MIFYAYIPNPYFSVGEVLQITDEEFHHIKHVLRTKQNDALFLLNGMGAVASGIVCDITKNSLLVRIDQVISYEKPHNCLILALPFLRPNHLDLVIEKGTEIGVTSFLLFPSETSEKKELTPTQATRLRHHSISAIKQSHRPFLPSIQITSSLHEAVAHLNPIHTIWCDFNEDGLSLTRHLQTRQPCPTVCFIGPESGFSKKEKAFLSTYTSPVLLNTAILRAETAAICAAYMLNSWIEPVAKGPIL